MNVKKQESIKVSVVVPAYNEEGNIINLVSGFQKFLSENSWLGLELILVDDGSTDQTFKKMAESYEKHDFVSIVRLRGNRGVTVALMEGFKRAKYDILVFYPADMQYLPADLSKLIEPLVSDSDIDIVCAKRIGNYNKWFVSKIYSLLSRWLFNVKVSDQNSIKAFRKRLLEDLHFRSSMHRYLVAIASYKGYKVTEVPICLYPRAWGKSKFVHPLRMLSGILDLISIKFELAFLDRPMIFFGGLSVFLILLGIVTGASFYLLRWLDIVSWQAKFTFLITAWGSSIIGLFLLCFGILSDFILRLMAPEMSRSSIMEYRSMQSVITGKTEQ